MARKTGTTGTAKKAAAFLCELEACGNVTRACKRSTLPLRTAYNRRDSDAKFAAAWDAALDRAVVQLEDEARRRAHDGTLKPVFYQGERCGQVREYSDTLLIFLLKAARPERYRERVSAELSGPGGGPLGIEVSDARAALLRGLAPKPGD